jgi:uncharacterized protein YkwD
MNTRPRTRRALLAVAGVALLAATASACAPPAAESQPALSAQSPAVAQALALVNNYRAANGLGPLVEAGDADAKAQQQANAMAAAGSIFHSDLAAGIQPGWHALGENVGSGANVDQVQASLQASAPHRANMLSGSYNQIGVGVAVGANGLTYVAQEFVGR